MSEEKIRAFESAKENGSSGSKVYTPDRTLNANVKVNGR
jgi:hypothetical protein